MSVRLAVPAVVAANRRFNHALAVWRRRKDEEAPVAHVCRAERRRWLNRSVACVSGYRVAHQIAEFLIRDFHRIPRHR